MSQSTDPSQALRSTLRTDLVAAMKVRDRDVVDALRVTLAVIDNAEAVAAPGAQSAVTSEHVAGARSGVGSTEAARNELSIAEVRALIQAQMDERAAEAEVYVQHGRQAEAERLRRQAAALRTYLSD